MAESETTQGLPDQAAAAAGVTATAPATGNDEASVKPLLAQIGISVLAAVFVCASAIGLYDWYTKGNGRFMSVDIQTVMDAKQIEFTELALKAGANDSDREKAIRLAADIPRQLYKVLDEITGECRCVLLVRAAVVSSRVPDVTDTVLERMGLSKEKVSQARRNVEDQLRESAKVDGAVIAPLPSASAGRPMSGTWGR